MTYDQIITALEAAANVVNPTGSFIHGRNSDAANSSDLPYPRIHLYPFTQERDPLETEKRNTPLLFSFVKADDGSQDIEQRRVIIAEMETLVDAFLAELEDTQSANMEFVSVVTEPQYQILEGVSGYSLQLRFKSTVAC